MSGGHHVYGLDGPTMAPVREDVRRESCDPTTPGERLRELLVQVAMWRLLHPDRAADLAWLEEAALLNPALPLDLLGQVLHLPPFHPWPRTAWYNPAVSLVLMREPWPTYEEAARLLLAHLSGVPHTSVPLASLVWLWSQRSSGSDPEKESARALARHLSTLFLLPRSG